MAGNTVRRTVRATIAAGVAAAVLTVAGCRMTVDDSTAPSNPGPGANGPQNPGPQNPGPQNPGPKNPVPSPPIKTPTVPPIWVPKGPARLTGCGSHASGHACAFHGSNFKPGEKVRLTRGFEDTGGNVFTADKNGEFSTDLVSNTHSGTYTYVAHGLSSHRQATTTVRITPGLWG